MSAVQDQLETEFEDFEIWFDTRNCSSNCFTGPSEHIKVSIDSYTVGYRHAGSQPYIYFYGSPTKHTLTIYALDVIKKLLNVKNNVCRQPYSHLGVSMIKQMLHNPNYFMTNYKEVEEMKQELEELLEDQKKKIEYYKGLEEKIRKIDVREKRVTEEREYLLAIKQKLYAMKEELDKEKARFNSINLDEFN